MLVGLAIDRDIHSVEKPSHSSLLSIRLTEGTIIDGKYQIEQPLGEGGMGSVYLARELDLGRPVAIKCLLPSLLQDNDSRSRFLREAKSLSLLSHKNIVHFYRFGFWQDQVPYIAMEYMKGKSLRSAIDEHGPLPWERAVSIVVQICDGMKQAHDAGIVHRDLKPSNVILLDSPADKVKLVDFGLSVLASPEFQKLTQTGALVGSVFYMSPEQARGLRAEASSDIYSVGCILYEMLAGEQPLLADNPVGLLHKHVHESPIPLSERKIDAPFPKELESICFKAMAKTPEERYRSMAEFADDLSVLLSGKLSQVIATPLPTPPKRTINPRSGLVSLGLVAIPLVVLSFTDPGIALPLAHLLKMANTKDSITFARTSAEYFESSGRIKGAALLYAVPVDRAANESITQTQKVLDKARLGQALLKDGKPETAAKLFSEAMWLAYFDIRDRNYPVEELPKFLRGVDIAASGLCSCNYGEPFRAVAKPSEHVFGYIIQFAGPSPAYKSIAELQLQIAKRTHSWINEANTYGALAQYYASTATKGLGDVKASLEKSLEYYSKAITCAEGHREFASLTPNLMNFYFERAGIYEQINQLDQADQDYANAAALLDRCHAEPIMWMQRTIGLGEWYSKCYQNGKESLAPSRAKTAHSKSSTSLDKAELYFTQAIKYGESNTDQVMKMPLALACHLRAQLYRGRGQTEKAEKDFVKLALLVKSAPNMPAASKMCFSAETGDWYAEQHYKTLSMSSQMHPKPSVASAHLNKAIFYYSEAIKYGESAPGDDTVKAHLLRTYEKKLVLLQGNRLDEVERDIARIDSLSREINATSNLHLDTLYQTASWYFSQYNAESNPPLKAKFFDKAVSHYSEVIARGENSANPAYNPWIMDAYYFRAQLYDQNGQSELAANDDEKMESYLNKGQDIPAGYPLSLGVRYWQRSLSEKNASTKARLLEKSIDYCSQAIKTAEKSGDPFFPPLLHAYKHRSDTYRLANQPDKADQDRTRLELAISNYHGDDQTFLAIANYLGDSYYAQSRQPNGIAAGAQTDLLRKAIYYNSQAIDSCEKHRATQSKELLLACYLKRAQLYELTKQQAKSAQDRTKLELLLSNYHGDQLTIIQTSNGLADLFQNQWTQTNASLPSASIISAEKAVYYLNRVIDYCQKHRDSQSDLLLWCYLKRAGLYAQIKQQDKADQDFVRLASQAKRFPNNSLHSVRSTVHLGQWQWEKYRTGGSEESLTNALSYFSDAIACAERDGGLSLKDDLMEAYAGRAAIYEVRKQPVKAREDYENQLSLMAKCDLEWNQISHVHGLLDCCRFLNSESQQISETQRNELAAILGKAQKNFPDQGWESVTKRSDSFQRLEKYKKIFGAPANS